MADRHVDHLLIGGGIASATCAQALVDGGARGSILLVGRELDPPYHRPPITKGYLQGVEAREEVLIALPDEVEVLTRTSVSALDPAARTATLSTKEVVSYDSALLATGAMVRRLQVEGTHLDGLHFLRALGNADALREDAEAADRVVCVGGSYIGCEVAASLTLLGKQVTIVMQEADPMERGFGGQVGGWIREVLEGHGVRIVAGAEVEAFESDDDRVQRVVLGSGERLDADLVVCGVGANPDVMLARKAGLELGPAGGVLTDRRLQTAHPGLYAAGDMCEYDSLVHGRVLRVEHEEVAAAQARTVAFNMLGARRDHVEVPYFFSDLADWASLEYVGPAATWDDEVVDGDLASGSFTVYYLLDGIVQAALSANGHADIGHAQALIADGEPFTAAS